MAGDRKYRVWRSIEQFWTNIRKCQQIAWSVTPGSRFTEMLRNRDKRAVARFRRLFMLSKKNLGQDKNNDTANEGPAQAHWTA